MRNAALQRQATVRQEGLTAPHAPFPPGEEPGIGVGTSENATITSGTELLVAPRSAA